MVRKDDPEKEILIVSITPYFLERDVFWYENNFEKIKKAARAQIWWKENTLFLEKDLKINLFALMRQILELGYEKVQTLGAPGEFSQRGGTLEIFPINCSHPWRLEFFGNKIENIEPLEIEILKSEKEIKKDLGSRQTQSLLYNLKPGDYLVHLDHGIGVFLGFAKTPGGPAKLAQSHAQRGGEISGQTPTEFSHDKFFVLEYAKSDRLYIPLDLHKKLSRYVGFERPIVHRLGGTLWFKTKRKAKENAIQLAKELLELYAKRSLMRGFKYAPDNELQRQLESEFPYVETEDQARAIDEVKSDMESPKLMDRLVCGDVGFGKTEVALRAAFKAVNSGKQVAFIAPTTILAWQHFQNFKNRIKKFPVNLALLTRLAPLTSSEKPTAESKKKVIENIKSGKADIVIGTHRLFSSDVHFKNLGLAIIDEEQRFGVSQKEYFKKIRSGEEFSKDESGYYGIDILSLSATPIPRTLHLTLSGLRDISLINTPPPGRLAVKTIIEPYNRKTVKDAIEKELERGGQVYYLHNRVETIEAAARKIKEYAPEAKIAIIHGRLPEKTLLKIIRDFDEQKINVLVATTIIENGLDFPNVNTLIVANAVRLGLAQAYQIRGRIGRSHIQAHAYFLYNAKHLTDEARQRLEALEEAKEVGSGYQIALRDLEIRGAGNILGREQSGPINAIGLNLYMQMLNETIEELKTNP